MRFTGNQAGSTWLKLRQTEVRRWAGTRFVLANVLVILALSRAEAQGCVDQAPPVIFCPANLIAYAPVGQCAASVTFLVSATNVCDAAPSVTCVPPSGSIFPIGRTSVLCRSLDLSGNTAETNFIVTVYPAPAVPPIQWQRSFGGGADDYLAAIAPCSDGGCVLGGTSYSSTTTNKAAPGFGSGDFWIVRLDGTGNNLWDRSFGGSGDDALYYLARTSDGGFILGGASASQTGGNKSALNYGGYDFWVVRITAAGEKLWDRSFGGSGDDFLYDLKETSDSGFILGGSSASNPSGTKTSPKYGRSDFWVVRLDVNGNLLWDRSFGGTADDVLTSLQATADGGFYLGGYSSSGSSITKTSPNRGSFDFWAIRINGAGEAFWDRSFGGIGTDQLYALVTTADGGCVLSGASASAPGGNKTSPAFGSSDFWVVRLDATGQKLWEQSCGGSGYDELRSLQSTADDGFLLGGLSASPASGTKSSSDLGGYDYWIVRLDANGTPLWDQTFGGTGWDSLYALQFTSDAGWLLAGYSTSIPGGNKESPNFGATDFWALRLAGTAPTILCPAGIDAECTGPAGALVTFNASATNLCQPKVAVTCLPPSGSAFPLGTNVVLCTATDALGATSQRTFPVIVRDTTPPTLVCPASLTVDVEAGRCLADAVALGSAFASDLSGTVLVTNDAPARFPAGTTLVLWTAQDFSGNTTFCTQTVTVLERELPTLNCPSNVVAFAPAGQCEARVEFTVIALDNCDPSPLLSCSPPSGSVFPVGRHTVLCTARDASGNVATQSFPVALYPPLSAPAVEWQGSFGGSGSDSLMSLQETTDGGFILGGYSASPPGGTKTSPNFGNYDYWFIRLNHRAEQLWERTFGGTSYDALTCLQQTGDGGYILGGTSASPPGGNKSSSNYGGFDFWIVRTDASGKSLWEKSFGGAGNDWLYCVQCTGDGGFLLGGWSDSPPSGTKTSPNHGDKDFWVVRLDPNGDLLWERSFGGPGADTLYDLRETSDGGFILGGSSASAPGGNKTSLNLGNDDFWLIRLDSNGNKQWDQSFGGSGTDVLLSLQQTDEGGFVSAGYSSSPPSGTKATPNYGDTDYWIVRTDSAGHQIWEQSFGGSGTDGFPPNPKICQTSDGEFIVGGQSASPASGNKLSPGLGNYDYWLVRLDASGTKLWEQSFGGEAYDALLTLQPTRDGGCLLGGTSFSGPGGNKFGPTYGNGDFWALKIAGPGPVILSATDQVVAATSPRGASITFDVSATNTCQPSVPVYVSIPSGSEWPLGTNHVVCVAIDAFGRTNTTRFSVVVTSPFISVQSVTVNSSPFGAVTQLRVRADCRHAYTLQRTSDLSSNSLWLDLAEGTPGDFTEDSELLVFSDTNAPSPSFYRVVWK